jgi:hypothetical protein
VLGAGTSKRVRTSQAVTATCRPSNVLAATCPVMDRRSAPVEIQKIAARATPECGHRGFPTISSTKGAGVHRKTGDRTLVRGRRDKSYETREFA